MKNTILSLTAFAAVLAGVCCVDFASAESVDPKAEITSPAQVKEPSGDLTMRQAVALALVHNPQLRAFSWDIRISEANRIGAGLKPNPELGIETEKIGASEGTETTVMLSQLIEMGDKRHKRVRYASIAKELAAMDYEARRLDTLTAVGKSFIDVLVAQRQVELSEQLVQIAQESLNAVKARVQAGKDAPAEETRAKIALSNVTIKLTQSTQDLTGYRKRLASYWGNAEPVFTSAVGALDAVSTIPSAADLIALIGDNPDIARWSLEIEKRRAALQLERAKGKGDITVSAGLQYMEESSESAMVVGLTLPIQFYNTNQAGRLRAANRMMQAAEEQKAAEIRINLALTWAHLTLSNAYMRMIELKNNVLQNAQMLYDAAKQGYEYGKFDYLHLLDAQRTLFEARQQYLESLAACHKGRADVERLIGQSIDNLQK